MIMDDDMHTPTFRSGPASGPRATTGVDKGRLSLIEFIAEKTSVEEELSALGSVLDSVSLARTRYGSFQVIDLSLP